MPTALDTGARATTPAAARGAADGADGAQGTHGALAEGGPLPPAYHRLYRLWFAFGIPAFAAMLGVIWLMLARPALG